MTELMRPGRLHWSIRESFREYVAAINDSETSLREDTVLDEVDRVVFRADPALPGDGDELREVLRFIGGVKFTAYRGVLTVRLRDPWLHLPTADADGEITVQHPAFIEETDRRVPIGRFQTVTRQPDQILIDGITMTEHGVRMLGDVYEIGAALDPVMVYFDE